MKRVSQILLFLLIDAKEDFAVLLSLRHHSIASVQAFNSEKTTDLILWTILPVEDRLPSGSHNLWERKLGIPRYPSWI